MKIIKLYLLTFLLLPLIGCYVHYFGKETIEGYLITGSILRKYTIHSLIIILFALSVKGTKKNLNFISSEYAGSILKNIRFLLILSLIVVIKVSFIPIFIQHDSDRGVVRASLGLLGPIYTFISMYLVVFSTIVTGLVSFCVENKKDIKIHVFTNFLLALFIAIGTGYKATVVTFIIPGIAFLLYNKSILKFVPYALLGSLLLIYATMKVRGVSIEEAWSFLKYRIFYLTNVGTIGTYYELGEGVPLKDKLFQFMSLFGRHITSAITGIPRNSPEFVKMDLSTYISYLIYPDKDGVLVGRVNLTVSNFGEAIFFLGKNFYFVFSILAGLLIRIILTNVDRYLIKGNIENVTLLAVFFFVIIIPWINSSGFFSFFSLPTIVYFTLIWGCIKFVKVKFVFKGKR